MTKVKGEISTERSKSRPGTNPKSRENQLVAKAVNLAEKQLDNNTASSQVICHFLKLGTERAKLEREKLEKENELLKAKTEAIRSGKRVEELYENALKAMRSYNGDSNEDY